MEKYNPQNVARKILESIQEARKNMTMLNVMVLGKTGAGKSTLINNVFNEELAETGIGKPVTDQIRSYSKEGFALTIYDTPGLELGGENSLNKLLKEVTDVIDKGMKSGDIEKAIHCIWYCVNTNTHRFEEAEKSFISRFLDEAKQYNVPVILVLTQSFSKQDAQELRSEIEKENLPLAQVVPVLAQDYVIDGEYTVKAYGLERLIEIMNSVIPESVKNTLIAVQKANIDMKRTRARAIVATSAATAAATGAVPVPFADAVLLVPEQIAMLAGITVTFGIPVEKATLAAVVSATVGTSGATALGRSAVGGLLKLIPGGGSVAGGVISASVAAAITAALGEAYIAVMTMVAKGEMQIGDLETKEGKKQITKLFKERLKIKRNDKGEEI
ncbi:MAG: 50S ribosome-binding GTPase [Lachnospiraceae bacterium]|nr:50S ribosome-binding GTPase [Lachnospiraceae bacterium]